MQHLVQHDDQLLAGLVGDRPLVTVVAEAARRTHPVQRLVRPVVGVHRHRPVGLDQQQSRRHRQVRGQPPDVVHAAPCDDQPHGRTRYTAMAWIPSCCHQRHRARRSWHRRNLAKAGASGRGRQAGVRRGGGSTVITRSRRASRSSRATRVGASRRTSSRPVSRARRCAPATRRDRSRRAARCRSGRPRAGPSRRARRARRPGPRRRTAVEPAAEQDLFPDARPLNGHVHGVSSPDSAPLYRRPRERRRRCASGGTVTRSSPTVACSAAAERSTGRRTVRRWTACPSTA